MPRNIFGALAAALRSDWATLARPEQIAPAGNWIVGLLLAGRGFGKTRAVAEWVRRKKRELPAHRGTAITRT
jgi:phage terminase large subunit-like protein